MIKLSKLKRTIQSICLFTLMWLMGIPHACASIAIPPHPTEYETHWGQNFALDVRRDFIQYFDNRNLIMLGDLFLVSGVLANTGLDRAFAQHWQTDLRSKGTNSFFEGPKAIGGLSYYYAPIYLLSMGIGHLREHSEFGNVLYHWGYRSARTFILGGLQQVILTNALGGGRPDRHEDSKWQPFRYTTAVSGHAFYGAVPFLTAAMMTDPPLTKAVLYTLSVLPGLSRINSNRHYLSQVLLGWGIAFLSARSVYASDMARTPAYQVNIYPKCDGFMLSGQLQF